ncbi:hypothetical protein KBX71_27115 [Micromonospora sp. D93]|uniref:hypothetical protein n=1 Tax=Micromonospora sp. D93 TaxID=2824886 RepID=UPI001B37D601|nr:hypothetical protein [Micromonospora sp. D93]MBQ1021525.1 hypothetical protein [Micromonospora sp. D93]
MTERILTELREKIRVAHGREPGGDHRLLERLRRRHRALRLRRRQEDQRPERFIVTDILGLLVTVWVLAASWQDRDGAKGALLATYAATPIRHVFADSGFAGHLVDWTRDLLRTTIEIVCKPGDQQGVRRWVVELTLECFTAHRPPPAWPATTSSYEMMLGVPPERDDCSLWM